MFSFISTIISTLIVGAVAGFLAGKIMKGSGFGAAGNIIVGVIGAILGWLVFMFIPFISIGDGWIGSILKATVGSVVLLFGAGLIKR